MILVFVGEILNLDPILSQLRQLQKTLLKLPGLLGGHVTLQMQKYKKGTENSEPMYGGRNHEGEQGITYAVEYNKGGDTATTVRLIPVGNIGGTTMPEERVEIRMVTVQKANI